MKLQKTNVFEDKQYLIKLGTLEAAVASQEEADKLIKAYLLVASATALPKNVTIIKIDNAFQITPKIEDIYEDNDDNDNSYDDDEEY